MGDVADMGSYFALTVAEVVDKMGSCNFSVGSSHLVQVTHINSPQSFFVRISCLRYAVKLLEVRGPPATISDLGLGSHVVYKSKTVRHCVRGLIQKMYYSKDDLGTIYTIFAIDYGFVDSNVVLKYIYLPKKTPIVCVPLALHCQLNVCEPIGEYFDMNTVHAMRFLVGRYTAKIIIRFKSLTKFKVELRTVECRDDVSTVLAAMNLTSFFKVVRVQSYTPSNPQPLLYRYRHRQIKMGDNFHVRVQNGSSVFSFHVADIEEYNRYDSVIEWYNFTKYCLEQPPLNVYEAMCDGRACGVRVQNPIRFERAIVTGITVPNAKALVHLVDWGKDIEANFGDIKPVYNMEFLIQPVMALYCSADRLQCMNYGLQSRMIYPGLEFLLEVCEPGNGYRIPNRVRLVPLFPIHYPQYSGRIIGGRN